MDQRIFVVKKEGFRVESTSLYQELKENLEITKLENVNLVNIYDVFDAEERDLQLLKDHVISEVVTDDVMLDYQPKGTALAMEFLPGQFDQRADSAKQCLMLLGGRAEVDIKSGKIVDLVGDLSDEDLESIKQYLINPVESREKDLSVLRREFSKEVEPVRIIEGYRQFTDEELEDFRTSSALALSKEDLLHIQHYFEVVEKRDPTETEIRVLDTYWSDHCRHTTFETELVDITFPEGLWKEPLERVFSKYLRAREEAQRSEKEKTLMDLATIVGRIFRKTGKLDDQEQSEEINACSIEIEVDEDGVKRPWLLMFKNETHNHPTEIEPYGGASTCVGGAIRDPLSGRSYVYQGMRLSGAGDITRPIRETIPYKLPQSVISKGAADGFSGYGNQIGLATTFVREVYHDGFVAKRMEVGAVVGAAPKENVRRETPKPTDVILLIGGDTGRDGIGGATGSSVVHTDQSLEKSSSEVQKGNAPVERKLQRLFRNPEATKRIIKSNDFGAGGVSVAVGELAPGLHIWLDRVPLKYEGLGATEIALSESQERMAVVVRKEDVEDFCRIAREENLETTAIAVVTEEPRLHMTYRDETVVNLSRAFLDTNGVRQKQAVTASTSPLTESPLTVPDEEWNQKAFLELLKKPNVAMQKGMIEKFDASVGRSTVLMPFGGENQMTETEGAVQKLPTDGFTNTASVMTFGYQPDIASYSPYLGAVYSVVESLAKCCALGADYRKARLTNQEYFEKLGKDDKKWGKPFSALLGLVEAQLAFETPSIGGKDSMSGTFNDLDVPPTLITFAVVTAQTHDIISSDWKSNDSYLYLMKSAIRNDETPDYDKIKAGFDSVLRENEKGNILSAGVVKFGGIAEIAAKMSYGNKIGAQIEIDDHPAARRPGSILMECKEKIEDENLIYIGKTKKEATIEINGVSLAIEDALHASLSRYESIYPTVIETDLGPTETKHAFKRNMNLHPEKIAKPRVIIPVFPGSNSEYDTLKAFNRAGAKAEIFVLNNLSAEALAESTGALADKIKNSQMMALVGGFSLGDEPDGSGKFIASVLRNEVIKEAVEELLRKDGLILGICNGFQALIKSGLLPTGSMDDYGVQSPTLFKNNINRHVSKVVRTRVTSNTSPWMSGFNVGDIHSIIVSHGEGKFVVDQKSADQLFERGQVAFQYVDLDGQPTMNGQFNPNSSMYAIESITSLDGKILGKMGHSERYEEGLLKNIPGNKNQDIFKNGVDYFK